MGGHQARVAGARALSARRRRAEEPQLPPPRAGPWSRRCYCSSWPPQRCCCPAALPNDPALEARLYEAVEEMASQGRKEGTRREGGGRREPAAATRRRRGRRRKEDFEERKKKRLSLSAAARSAMMEVDGDEEEEEEESEEEESEEEEEEKEEKARGDFNRARDGSGAAPSSTVLLPPTPSSSFFLWPPVAFPGPGHFPPPGLHPPALCRRGGPREATGPRRSFRRRGRRAEPFYSDAADAPRARRSMPASSGASSPANAGPAFRPGQRTRRGGPRKRRRGGRQGEILADVQRRHPRPRRKSNGGTGGGDGRETTDPIAFLLSPAAWPPTRAATDAWLAVVDGKEERQQLAGGGGDGGCSFSLGSPRRRR